MDRNNSYDNAALIFRTSELDVIKDLKKGENAKEKTIERVKLRNRYVRFNFMRSNDLCLFEAGAFDTL